MEPDFIIRFFLECKKFCIKKEKIAGRTNTRGAENCIAQGLAQDFLTEILQRVPLWTAVSLGNRSESNPQRTAWQRSLFCALCICECILFSKDNISHICIIFNPSSRYNASQSFLKKGFYSVLCDHFPTLTLTLRLRSPLYLKTIISVMIG